VERRKPRPRGGSAYGWREFGYGRPLDAMLHTYPDPARPEEAPHHTDAAEEAVERVIVSAL